MDAQVAPFAHRIGIAALERLIAEAIARFMPDQAAEDAAEGCGRSALHHRPPAGLLRRHQPAHRRARPRRRPRPRRRRREGRAGAAGRWGRPSPSTYAARSPPARSPATSSPSTSSAGTDDEAATTRAASRPKPRQVVLHVHLSDAAITGTSDGRWSWRGWRTSAGSSPPTRSAPGAPTPTPKSIVKPVIDLDEHIHVEGYEVPDRLREQSRAARPHLRVPLVHPISPEDGCRPRHPLRRGRHHEQRQHRTAVPTASSTENPFGLDLHDARTRVVPVVEPARLPVPARPPRHPRRQPRPVSVLGHLTVPGLV